MVDFRLLDAVLLRTLWHVNLSTGLVYLHDSPNGINLAILS